MYDIVSWFGEVIAAFLAIMILVFVTLLCVARGRSRAYTSEVLPSPTEIALNLQKLSSELAAVTDWFSLGLNFGLQKHELTKIERDYQGNDRRRVEMLDLWLHRTPNATWEDVVRALQQMGENTVAEIIREKYIRGRNHAGSFLDDSGNAEIAQKNKQTIDAKFATLLLKVCRKLGEREINAKDLHIFLISCFPPGECIPRSADIHEVFEAITSNKLWDSWNYLPLKRIVEGFAADDEEIASWIEAYRQDLKSYKATTKLIDQIAAAETDSTVPKPEEQDHDKAARYDKDYYQKISVKLNSRFTDQTMEYIDDLWHEMSGLYDVPRYLILLDSVRKGCVAIVWRIPSGIAPKILEAPPPSDKFYHKHGITRVEYGGEGIYQEGEFAVSGPGLKFATTSQASKFIVCTYGTHRRHRPVQQNVSAELKSLVDGSVLQATVMNQKSSTYELSYTPTTRGRHQLTVRIGNTEIGTFQVFVQHPPTQLDCPVRTIEGVTAEYIVVGDKGELFVTEHWDYRYTVLDAQGQRVLTTGSRGAPPFGYGKPTGIATDREGNVYVASGHGHVASAHKMQKLNRRGDVVKSVGKWGRGPGEFIWPYGVRYHNHKVYVCDKDNARVQMFDSDLDFVRSFRTTGDGPGLLKQPWDMDFDAQGNIYVVDSNFMIGTEVDRNKQQVIVFSKDGQYLRHFGQWGDDKGQLRNPQGICVSGDYVFITDFHNHRVSVFRTSGEFVCSFGEKGSGRGVLNSPWGIAIDRDGFVFVCDKGNSRIQVF